MFFLECLNFEKTKEMIYFYPTSWDKVLCSGFLARVDESSFVRNAFRVFLLLVAMNYGDRCLPQSFSVSHKTDLSILQE